MKKIRYCRVRQILQICLLIEFTRSDTPYVSIPEAGKVSIVAAFSPEVNKKGVQAGKFVETIAKICGGGGGGGGKPNLAQAGGRDASKLPEALETAKNDLLAALS